MSVKVKAVNSWQAKNAALESVFRKLPIRLDSTMYKCLIPGIPRQLLLMAPISRNSRSKVAGAKKGLQRLAQSTRSSINALEGLSQTALDALNYKSTAIRGLTTKLRVLHAAAELATKENAPPGRPAQISPSQVKKIACAVAQHYRGLTGDEATAPKRLITLLGDVYKVLDIEANARGQLEAIKREEESTCIFPTRTEYAQEIVRRNEAKRREEAEAKARSHIIPK